MMTRSKLILTFVVQTMLFFSGASDSSWADKVDPKNKEGDAAVKELMTTKTIVVGKGDTLGTVLQKAGISETETHQALTHLQKKFNPKDLQIGQPVSITFTKDEADSEKRRLCRLKVPGGFEKDWIIEQNQGENDFSLQEFKRPIETAISHHKVTIQNSIFVDGVRDGIPEAVLVNMVKQLSFDLDFQRDIQPDSTFEVIYEQSYDPSRHQYKAGKILFASITVDGKPHELYLFTDKNGDEEYYNPKGESIKKALLRTPLDAIRITSKFGKRRHPVLGYTKMHKGVDFAAPTGTPIFAAGNGTVKYAGVKGGYGNYIMVQHTGSYSTAYAHLSRFRKGLKTGQKVKQGEVIGYVGSTGMSTGPHLHYEVLIDNKHVNPLGVKMASEKKLAGPDLKAFEGSRVKTAELRKSSPALVRRLTGPLNTAAQFITDLPSELDEIPIPEEELN